MRLLRKILSLLGFRVDFYIDLDGTIADLYSHEDWYEKSLNDPDFYASLLPFYNFLSALRLIKIQYGPIVNMKALSAVLNEAKEPIMIAKDMWIDANCDFFDGRILCENGTCKADLIKNISKKSILFDDYSQNCNEWLEKGGTSYKVYNGNNCRKGNWTGPVIYNQAPISELYDALDEIIKNVLLSKKKIALINTR